jgi:hypothetical protein
MGHISERRTVDISVNRAGSPIRPLYWEVLRIQVRFPFTSCGDRLPSLREVGLRGIVESSFQPRGLTNSFLSASHEPPFV